MVAIKKADWLSFEGHLALAGFHGGPVSWSSWHFEMLIFPKGRNIGVPGEKPSEKRRELTKNPTHIWYRAESNLGHIGERRALSQL